MRSRSKKEWIFLATTVALLLGACGDENSKLRGEFVSGCVQGGSRKSACECLFAKLEEHYSPKELRALNQTRTPPQEFKQVVANGVMSCRTQ